MAATAKNVGSWTDSNATTQALTLPAHVAGDMLGVVAACKPYTADPTITVATGWTRLYTYADGAVANGNGTGSVRQCVFYKIAASSSETNPTVSWGTTSAPGIAVPFVLQKGASDTWDTPLSANGNTNAATAISVSLASPTITADGIGLVIHTTRDNSALTVPNWDRTGATLGTLTEWPDAAISSATSNDMAGDMAYRTVTAVGSGNITATGTQAAAETGVTSFVFFGVTPAAPDPITGTGAGSGFNSTSTGSASETMTGTGAAGAAAATAAGAAAETFTGTGAAAGAASTASGTGTHEEASSATGTGAGAQAVQTATGTGAETFTATGAATGAASTASGTGSETMTGTGAGAQVAATAEGSSALIIIVEGAALLAAPMAAGEGAISESEAPPVSSGGSYAPRFIVPPPRQSVVRGSGQAITTRPTAQGSGFVNDDDNALLALEAA